MDKSKIEHVENFVRTELLTTLEARCNRSNVVFNQTDEHNFLGIYTKNKDQFKIFSGEESLLLGIAKYLNAYVDGESFEDMAKVFKVPPNFKMSRKDTVPLSVGLFYTIEKNAFFEEHQPQQDELVNNLFSRIRPLLERISDKISPVRTISSDIIELKRVNNRFRANMICVFCKENDAKDDGSLKKICLQEETLRSSQKTYWNICNVRKHLKVHEEQNTKSRKNTANEESSSIGDTNTEQIMDKNEIIVQTFFYKQLANQVSTLMAKTAENKDLKTRMVIKQGSKSFTVDVSKTKEDGNCLFASAAHQLFYAKIGSDDHTKYMNQVREECAEHIILHYDRYFVALKMTLEEEKEDKDSDNDIDFEIECKKLAEKRLLQDGFWGGAESVMAISEVYKTNIIMFNENSSCYYVNGFNSNYSETILFAYRQSKRKKKQKTYNHYDSVCGLSKDSMLIISEFLNKTV